MSPTQPNLAKTPPGSGDVYTYVVRVPASSQTAADKAVRVANPGGRPARLDLWGAKQVAEHLGVLHPNLYKMPGLPEPIISPERGRLWLADDVRRYGRKRRAQHDRDEEAGRG